VTHIPIVKESNDFMRFPFAYSHVNSTIIIIPAKKAVVTLFGSFNILTKTIINHNILRDVKRYEILKEWFLSGVK